MIRIRVFLLSDHIWDRYFKSPVNRSIKYQPLACKSVDVSVDNRILLFCSLGLVRDGGGLRNSGGEKK